MRDGIIYTGIEECDDGNTADNDAAAAIVPCTMWRRHRPGWRRRMRWQYRRQRCLPQ